MQETITSNVVEDIITLEFQRSDGTLVTLLLDSRNVSEDNTSISRSNRKRFSNFFSLFFPDSQEVQILKALVLGEEERGQSQYQVMCFVTKFVKSDFISSDAMAKLRQVSTFLRMPKHRPRRRRLYHSCRLYYVLFM